MVVHEREIFIWQSNLLLKNLKSSIRAAKFWPIRINTQ